MAGSAVSDRIACFSRNHDEKISQYLVPLCAILFIFLILPDHCPAQTGSQPVQTPALEETLLFQEIPSVYGASKFEQKLSEAPASVSIVTANDIKMYGYRTLAEILQSVPGFFTFYDRDYSYVGVRGFGRPGDYSTRVLLMVDGHRINDSVYDQAFVGTDFPLDVDLIDRVEIIRGPSSSIYGTNAFFGVINVITRRGRDLKGVELSGEAGSFESYKGRISYGNRFQNGLEMLLSGSTYWSNGQDLYFKEFDHPWTNHGVARNCDDDQFSNLFSRFAYGDFTFEGGYHSRDKGVPTAPYETAFNDTRTKTEDERTFLDLKYDHAFENHLGLMTRLYYDRYDYDGTWINDSESGKLKERYINKDYARGEWLGTEVQLSRRFFEKHRFILGAEYRENLRQDQGTYDLDPYYLYLKKDASSWNGAVYLQDEFQILSNLILNAGVRYDYYETFGGTTNPRIALIYNPYPKTALKLLYGQAFRAPNAYELYYSDESTMKAPSNLDPETITTYEFVWEQGIGSHLRMAVSAYFNQIDNLISLTRDPHDGLMVFRNIDSVEAKGLEWELDGRWARGIETRISYSIQETCDGDSGNRLTNSPLHMAKLNLIVPVIQNKVFLGTEVRYMSDRKTLAGKEADGAAIVNVTLFTRNLVKGLELSASVYNLFDVDYGDPGSVEHIQDVIDQDGINFRVKATYSF